MRERLRRSNWLEGKDCRGELGCECDWLAESEEVRDFERRWRSKGRLTNFQVRPIGQAIAKVHCGGGPGGSS